MPSSFKNILAKCKRTGNHLEEIEALLEKFLAVNPYIFQAHDDVSAGKRIIRFRLIEVPPEIPIVIGDMLYGMRSTLDHIAYNLALVKDPLTKLKPYFPIGATPEEYKDKAAKEKGAIGQSAIDLIDTVEPYQGGKGEILWHMHSANNFAKHKLLPAITGDLIGHTIPQTYIDETIAALPAGYPADSSRLKGLVITPKPDTVITKSSGTELTIPLSKNENEMDFTVEIAFGEPEILLGKAVVGTLHRMNKAVLEVVKAFHDKGLL